MTGLNAAQIAQYRKMGYVAPIRIMSTAQAQTLRERLEEFERIQGSPLHGSQRHKSHLLFTWLSDLVRMPAILNVIEDLYGANLLCWTSNFFIKEPNDPAFVSWHQDSTYWGLSRPDVVTAWVALSHSNDTNGAMQVIPGTHLQDQIPHRDTFSSNNLLTRGQEVAVEIDAAQAVSINLKPGEMSLHHVRIIHGSPPNHGSERRIGFAIRYIPTYVRQLQGNDSATLVRGTDTVNTFEHEPQPQRDLDPPMVELHRTLTARNAQILYAGTGVNGFDDDSGNP